MREKVFIIILAEYMFELYTLIQCTVYSLVNIFGGTYGCNYVLFMVKYCMQSDKFLNFDF